MKTMFLLFPFISNRLADVAFCYAAGHEGQAERCHCWTGKSRISSDRFSQTSRLSRWFDSHDNRLKEHPSSQEARQRRGRFAIT